MTKRGRPNLKTEFVFFIGCAIMFHIACAGQTSPSQMVKVTFPSQSLGIEKSFNIYLPQGYDDGNEKYPVLYLFRGHEDEWIDRGNIKELVDEAVTNGEIGEIIIVLPGLTFGENFVGWPVNLIDPGQSTENGGFGSGKFEDYIIKDLIPYVDSHFKTIADRSARAVDGFSAGAFSSVFLAVRHPALFCSVGSYDGNFGYLDFDDPSTPGERDDSVYLDLPVLDPYFGNPRDMEYMTQCNPTNIINDVPPAQLEWLKETRFFIRSASQNAKSAYMEGTYYPRVKQFVELMESKGIMNHWNSEELVLSSTADHTWEYAKLWIKTTLPLHWEVFGRYNEID